MIATRGKHERLLHKGAVINPAQLERIEAERDELPLVLAPGMDVDNALPVSFYHTGVYLEEAVVRIEAERIELLVNQIARMGVRIHEAKAPVRLVVYGAGAGDNMALVGAPVSCLRPVGADTQFALIGVFLLKNLDGRTEGIRHPDGVRGSTRCRGL